MYVYIYIYIYIYIFKYTYIIYIYLCTYIKAYLYVRISYTGSISRTTYNPCFESRWYTYYISITRQISLLKGTYMIYISKTFLNIYINVFTYSYWYVNVVQGDGVFTIYQLLGKLLWGIICVYAYLIIVAVIIVHYFHYHHYYHYYHRYYYFSHNRFSHCQN
jgi:hypothetical protein